MTTQQHPGDNQLRFHVNVNSEGRRIELSVTTNDSVDPSILQSMVAAVCAGTAPPPKLSSSSTTAAITNTTTSTESTTPSDDNNTISSSPPSTSNLNHPQTPTFKKNSLQPDKSSHPPPPHTAPLLTSSPSDPDDSNQHDDTPTLDHPDNDVQHQSTFSDPHNEEQDYECRQQSRPRRRHNNQREEQHDYNVDEDNHHDETRPTCSNSTPRKQKRRVQIQSNKQAQSSSASQHPTDSNASRAPDRSSRRNQEEAEHITSTTIKSASSSRFHSTDPVSAQSQHVDSDDDVGVPGNTTNIDSSPAVVQAVRKVTVREMITELNGRPPSEAPLPSDPYSTATNNPITQQKKSDVDKENEEQEYTQEEEEEDEQEQEQKEKHAPSSFYDHAREFSSSPAVRLTEDNPIAKLRAQRSGHASSRLLGSLNNGYSDDMDDDDDEDADILDFRTKPNRSAADSKNGGPIGRHERTKRLLGVTGLARGGSADRVINNRVNNSDASSRLQGDGVMTNNMSGRPLRFRSLPTGTQLDDVNDMHFNDESSGRLRLESHQKHDPNAGATSTLPGHSRMESSRLHSDVGIRITPGTSNSNTNNGATMTTDRRPSTRASRTQRTPSLDLADDIDNDHNEGGSSRQDDIGIGANEAIDNSKPRPNNSELLKASDLLETDLFHGMDGARIDDVTPPPSSTAFRLTRGAVLHNDLEQIPEEDPWNVEYALTESYRHDNDEVNGTNAAGNNSNINGNGNSMFLSGERPMGAGDIHAPAIARMAKWRLLSSISSRIAGGGPVTRRNRQGGVSKGGVDDIHQGTLAEGSPVYVDSKGRLTGGGSGGIGAGGVSGSSARSLFPLLFTRNKPRNGSMWLEFESPIPVEQMLVELEKIAKANGHRVWRRPGENKLQCTRRLSYKQDMTVIITVGTVKLPGDMLVTVVRLRRARSDRHRNNDWRYHHFSNELVNKLRENKIEVTTYAG